MSSYTKYHKAYSEKHKDKLNEKRVMNYHRKKYGIPAESFDEYITDFRANKRDYLTLVRLSKKLNTELVRIMLSNVLARQ
tara:strand:+ start:269 stop:508 length:240 start_codon:yes stop_codon:yes gene_type:complete